MTGLVPGRQPAEFTDHERTLISWPCRTSVYGHRLDEARAAHAELATAIARFEPVTMLTPADDTAAAEAACGPSVDVLEMPLDDSWIRDNGPIYVFDGDGRRRARSFRFNGWGEKYRPFDADDAVPVRLGARWNEPTDEVDLVFEGGSLTVDGLGTGITTTQCLLHPNRNPNRSRLDIEDVVRTSLGVDRLIWLPHGLADDHDTDGHVDNVAAFARAGQVLLQGCDDPGRPDHERMAINRRWLTGTPDALGNPIEVIEVPILPFHRFDTGEEVPVPYLNFYVGNGFVAVPVCGHAADDDMVGLIADAFPERTTFGLEIGAILALGGGGIHCITQQLPVTKVS